MKWIKNKKGAEDTFKNILFAFILFALFGFLILTAVVQMGTDYGKNVTEVTGGALNINAYNSSISNINKTAQNFQERFTKQSVWSALAGVVVEGFFNIANDLFKIIFLPFNLLQNVMLDVFHIPAIVTSVIWALIILSVMFGIWRLIRVGD